MSETGDVVPQAETKAPLPNATVNTSNQSVAVEFRIADLVQALQERGVAEANCGGCNGCGGCSMIV